MAEQIDKELLEDFNKLSSQSQSKKLSDEFIFKKLSEFDKKYKNNKNYFVSIEGVLSNIGAEQKSINILNCAISRLKQKKEKLPINKYYYDIGNTILSKTDIENNNDFNFLIETGGYREAVMCLKSVKKDNTDFYERAQTNISNVYEKYRRNYEAILAYDKVLKINPSFGMALGNKAIALKSYNKLSHRKSLVILYNALLLLEKALKDENLIDTGGQVALNTFKNELNSIKEHFDKIKYKPVEIAPPKYLTKYERFNLKNNLYLNYDFGYYYDKYSLLDSFFPSITENLRDKPSEKSPSMSEKTYFSFQIFNQILEDYTTARYNFYKAINIKCDSIDKKVKYIYTLDYTKHSLKYGILKSIFGTLYNCLDKIAHLIKFYFSKSEINPNDNTHLKWLISKDFKQVLKESKNYHLLALFGLAFDFEKGYPYHYLKEIRNRITHSFLNINPGIVYSPSPCDYEITEQMLIDDIFELFNIVKAAMLYSVNAIYYEKGTDNIVGFPATFESDIYKFNNR